jgi:hypothetical protein
LLTSFPGIQDNANLGRLKTTTAPPTGKVVTGSGKEFYNQLYSYGARSFSIWTAGGDLVFDSGDQLEQITAAALPDDFNSTDNENGSFDDRSDDKGPEPEAVVLGELGGRTYAFVGLERIGGIMVYDVTDPSAPTFELYVNTRDFSVPIEIPLLDDDGNPVLDDEGEPKMVLNPDWQDAGDLAPEGLKFIPPQGPGEPALLAVANEVSGTTTIYEITLGEDDAVSPGTDVHVFTRADWLEVLDERDDDDNDDARDKKQRPDAAWVDYLNRFDEDDDQGDDDDHGHVAKQGEFRAAADRLWSWFGSGAP